MNRRSFLKFLGIGTATAAVAPKVLAVPEHIIGLEVYEEPRNADYSIGVDTGDGIRIPSCVSVMRIGEYPEPDVQVAEFFSEKINPIGLVPIVAHIARMYGTFCKDADGPLLVIEQVQAYGDIVQNHLKVMGFKRFYKAVWRRSDGTIRTRDGWHSNRQNGPIVKERFRTAVERGWYVRNSKELGVSDPNDTRFTAAAQSYIAARYYGG